MGRSNTGRRLAYLTENLDELRGGMRSEVEFLIENQRGLLKDLTAREISQRNATKKYSEVATKYADLEQRHKDLLERVDIYWNEIIWLRERIRKLLLPADALPNVSQTDGDHWKVED